MPTPMMPPTPIAVSCQRPEALGEVAYVALFLDLLDVVDREPTQDRWDSYSSMCAPPFSNPSGLRNRPIGRGRDPLT
jgi:hypothetical protein